MKIFDMLKNKSRLETKLAELERQQKIFNYRIGLLENRFDLYEYRLKSE